MIEDEAGPATIADRLAAARRRQLVGRDAELAIAREVLGDDARQTAALFFHGPGGVGKSALLRGIEDLAIAHGWRALLVDGADVDATPDGVMGAIRDTAQAAPDQPWIHVLRPRTVLLLDTFEALAGLEGWMRRSLVPSFPDGVVLVAAGRRPPADGWMTEPGWRDLVRVIALRNLDPASSRALLRARDVPLDEVDDIVRVTFGHPLALVVAADVVMQRAEPSSGRAGGSRPSPLSHPDAAVRLLSRFVDEVEDPRQRAALHLCGHARRVDLAMLRTVLALDAEPAERLFAWLRARPYITPGAEGLQIHEVVRDALDADLRWRDHDAFVDLHRRIRLVVVDRAERRTGREQQRVMADLLFLHRGNHLATRFHAYDRLGSGWSRPSRGSDNAVIVDAIHACEGAAQARAAGHWHRLQPDRFRIHEDASGEVRGTVGFVRLDLATPADRAADPVAALVWDDLLPGQRPPRADEAVLYSPAAAERGTASDTYNAVTDLHALASLVAWTWPKLGWAVTTTTREALWGPMWAYIGFQRLGQLPLEGRVTAIWGRDFGRSPFGEWIDQLGRQEMDVSGDAPAPVAAPLALSRPDFAAAVRQALKDLHRPDRLATNPLRTSRLLAAGTTDAAAGLAARIRQAADLLADDPRDDRGRRALDRTFLRPAATQEAAAEVLGLPFSTFRRHLGEGIDRLTELLWSWELHGPPHRPGSDEQQLSSNRSGG